MNARDPRLYVESAGAGAPLVLLHGFAMHGGIFEPLLPALSTRYRVHVVDLPGHGRSAPGGADDLASLAQAVAAALPDVDEPATLLGWSLGGQVALQMATAHPSRIRRLVLVATSPAFVRRADWPHAMAAETLDRFGGELRADYRLTLLRFLTLQVQGSDDGRRTLAALRQRFFERDAPAGPSLDSALRLLKQSDLREALPGIRVPSLVIAGDRDTLVPLAATEALARALPDAAHATIVGAAHAPFLSHPRAFLDVLRSHGDG